MDKEQEVKEIKISCFDALSERSRLLDLIEEYKSYKEELLHLDKTYSSIPEMEKIKKEQELSINNNISKIEMAIGFIENNIGKHLYRLYLLGEINVKDVEDE